MHIVHGHRLFVHEVICDDIERENLRKLKTFVA